MKLSSLNQILIIFIATSFRIISLFYSSTILNYFLLVVLVGLTFYNILTKKFNINQFRKTFILLLLSAVIFIIYNEDNLFIYLVASLAFLEESDDKLVKYFTISAIITFISVIIAGQLGIVDVVTANRYLEDTIITRNSLGFGHVNAVFVYYLGIMFGIYYLFCQKKKNLLSIYLITTIIAVYLYLKTNCRTGFYLYLIFIILSFIYTEKLNNKLRTTTPYLFIIFTIFSFLIAIMFGPNPNNTVNNILSSRPYFSYYYIKNYSFLNLFGQELTPGYVLDNNYLSLLVKTGLTGFLTYMYIFIKGSKIIIKDKRGALIILFYLIYSIFETNLYGNFVVILLIKKIINDNGGKEDERKN